MEQNNNTTSGQWVSIKDRLPDAGQRVYLWIVPINEEKSYRISWTWEKESTKDIRINGNKVTHWIYIGSPISNTIQSYSSDDRELVAVMD